MERYKKDKKSAKRIQSTRARMSKKEMSKAEKKIHALERQFFGKYQEYAATLTAENLVNCNIEITKSNRK